MQGIFHYQLIQPYQKMGDPKARGLSILQFIYGTYSAIFLNFLQDQY
ncbi:MAG TPA: hypothetical protein VMX16_17755 [Terriglobia bacterium]|nr:hypothetical protein [Terriglobia bacterium]